MIVALDTLAFAEKFEHAGFQAEQARVLDGAFGQTQEGIREGLVTKDHLDARLAELEARLTRQLADMDARLTRQIADNGKDISARLWSTIAVIAGVSTAISATVAGTLALLFRAGGI